MMAITIVIIILYKYISFQSLTEIIVSVIILLQPLVIFIATKPT